ncbi:MAG: hypothetical protein AB7N61_15705 [Acidimicrobiia bacterium]
MANHSARRAVARRVSFLATGATAVLVLAACSGGDDPTAVESPLSTVSTLTQVSTVPAASAAPAAQATSTPIDVAALLNTYATGYTFSTTAKVNGQVSVKADGRRVADSTAMVIVGNGVPVEQITTPGGTWARTQGQDWTLVEAAGAATDPLAPLRAPMSTAVNGDGTVSAVYAAEAFGLNGGQITVVLTPEAGRLARARYETTASGQPAVVEATFSPLADATPISAPA